MRTQDSSRTRRPSRSLRSDISEEHQGLHDGKDHRLHGARANRRGLHVDRRARQELQGIRRRTRCGAVQGAGRTLHGLRHAVLQQRVSGQQRHSRLQRPRVPGRLAECLHGARLHQQLSGVHGSNLPGALRSCLCTQCERRSCRHQVDRARDHRPGLGRGLGGRASSQAQDGQEGRSSRLRPRRHGGRAAAGAGRP